jgi:hypothetical protein
MTDDEAKGLKVFYDYTNRYLNTNAYDPEDLKSFLNEKESAKDKELFRLGLKATIELKGMNVDEWRDLANHAVYDQDEWIKYLQTIYDYIFENGLSPQ